MKNRIFQLEMLGIAECLYNKCAAGAFSMLLMIFGASVCFARPAPGSGVVGQSMNPGGSGCQSCRGDTAGPTPGFYVSVSMGGANHGGEAGNLQVYAATPNTNFMTPAGLVFTGCAAPGTGVMTVTNSGGSISQVIAPQAFANITVITNGFQISIYQTNAIGTWDGKAFSLLETSSNLIAKWAITNPDGTNACRRAQVTENLGTTTNVWLWSYGVSNGVWTNSLPGGYLEQRMSQAYNSTDLTRTEDVQWAATSGPVFYEHQKVFTNFSWGEALCADIVGCGPQAKITSYSYYADTNSVGFAASSSLPPVQTEIHSDGAWKYFSSYDANGRPLLVLSGTTGAPTKDLTACRSIQYSYTPVASGDDGTLFWNAARQETESLYGTVVSMTYRVYMTNQYEQIQCLSPIAAYDNAANLVTTTKVFTSGPNSGCIQSIEYPNHTLSVYDYETNSDGSEQTNTIWNGAPDSGGTVVVDGTKSVSVLGSVGQLLSTATYDVASGNLLGRDCYTYLDLFQRSYSISHLDGTSETRNYGCCGLESTIDRDGVATVWLYDSANRQSGYQKIFSDSGNPIVWKKILDPAGRVVQAVRIGTDGSAITNDSILYDTASRLLAETNVLCGVTEYSETNGLANGGLILATTNPDLGVTEKYYNPDGSVDSVFGTATHGSRYVYGVDTDENGNTCTTTETIKLKADGSDSDETTTTFTDMAGRNTETLYADGSYSQNFYNSLGQLTNSVDPDGVSTLYGYNARGQLAYSVVDMDQAGYIQFDSNDRIIETTNDVVSDYGTTVNRTQTFGWLNGSPVLLSKTETSTDGLNTWQTRYRDASTPVTTHSQTVPGVSKTITTTAPDGSTTMASYSYGRLISMVRRDAMGGQIGATTYGYDAHGRQNTTKDARNGITTLVYNNADQVTTNITPSPGGGGSPEVTVTSYDTMLRPCQVIQPDGTVVYSQYLSTGELGMQYGSRTYPVAYSYDYAGRVQTMTNWSGFNSGGVSSGARVTTWIYDGNRGWLQQKIYDDGNGPTYQYTPAGRLRSRAWVRGITTSYAYDPSGSLTNVNYSDGTTPSVAYAYDQLGRQTSVMWSNITDNLSYNLANQLLSESYTGGKLNGLVVSNTYDADLRRVNLQALASGSSLLSDTYGYDQASRLRTVTDAGNNSATYSYLANSSLVGQIMFAQSGSTRMLTTKQYDDLNRLTQISSQPSAGGSLPFTYNYNYNSANQRTKDTLADGSYWQYGYDSLGQVTNGTKYFASGTPVAGQQFGYSFDTIGNRTQTQTGGDQTSHNLRIANYSANNLNQITSRDVPPYVDIQGASLATNSVTVNGQATYRNGEYFRAQIPANNRNSALWTNIVVSGGQSVTGNVFVAQEPEAFQYDADGNLTNDGRWAYVWDGENRLVQMTVNTNVGPQYMLTFAYDYQGRRIQKVVATNSATYETNNFLHDGWNLVAVLTPSSSILNSFVWGSDLSGSMQGAGGVGGLLETSSYGSGTTNSFAAFDGNGNVAGLVSAVDGTVEADYEYGPFGEVIRATGPMAKANPIRWSTKYQDGESDLIMYPYRPYKASTGTWLSRDPLNAVVGAEARYELLENYGFDDDFAQTVANIPADLNDYIFVHNRPVTDYDLLGLCDPLPDSGPGDFHSNLWGHNLFHGPASSLTFKVCCPAAEQYLASYGISALTSPPPTTGHGHNFPGDFTTVTPPSGSGPCYTIVINVTSTSSLEYDWQYGEYANFIKQIRVVGQCCACSSGPPTRNDPPPLPPSPPPHRHGSGL